MKSKEPERKTTEQEIAEKVYLQLTNEGMPLVGTVQSGEPAKT